MVISNRPAGDGATSDPLFRGYTRKAKWFWWALVVMGAWAVLSSIRNLLQMPADSLALLALCLVLVGVSAAFPIKFATRKLALSFGDFYLLLTLFALGPSAATVAATLEGYVGARLVSRRMTSRVASPAIGAISMLAAGEVYQVLVTAWFPASHLPSIMAASVIAALVWAAGMVVFIPAISALNRMGHLDLVTAAAYVTTVVLTAILTSTIVFAFRDSLAVVMVTTVPLLAAIIIFMHSFRRRFQQSLASQAREVDAWKSTSRVHVEQVRELRESERRLNEAFRNAAVGAAFLQLDGTIVQANDALCRLLRRPESALIRSDLASYLHDGDRQQWLRQLRRAEDDLSPQFSADLRFEREHGHVVWLSIHCSAFADPKTSLPGLILYASDITASREAAANLKRLADHDPLTGLPNQRSFKERLGHALNVAFDDRASGIAVMFLDFDGFKAINDRYGHAAGDRFLIEMASRMASNVRPGDLVARLGGDEFAVLVHTAAEPARDHVEALARRIIECVAAPYLLADTEISAGVSIGIAAGSLQDRDAEQLIEKADAAMYEVKASGKRGFAFAR